MQQTSHETESRILRLDREFNASPEQVYDAWTDPEQLVQWWGPEGMTIPDCRMDLRVGGHWTTTMLSAEGNRHTVQGVYTVLDRPHHIAFTWAWLYDEGLGHETIVDVHLERTERGGTKLTMVQQIFAEEEHRNNHESGWSSTFNCLEVFLSA
ncbi:SRPBCC family protein [Coralliovum pocilloporae]|uniref:SRPBCC family protein n=1 Tax=Coralliovum pocilloporae TaxID=3066369 RepID=UPI003307299B